MAPQSHNLDKSGLIDQLTARTQGLTKAQITSVVNEMIGTIQDTLIGGGTVRLTGFGTFRPTERAERQGVNPQTRQPLTIRAQRSARWTPGDTLKLALAGGNSTSTSAIAAAAETTTSNAGGSPGRQRGRATGKT